MAKKLDKTQTNKKEKRNFALRHATEQEEEKKGGPLSSDSQEVSSESEREQARKLREAAAKLEENNLPLKVWTRRIKIAVAVLMLLSTAFMNGLFTGTTHEGVVVDRQFNSEFASWNNLILTLKESWFMIVAFAAYLLMAEYNRRLDEEEQKIIEELQKEEKQYEVDDSETTSQDAGSSSGQEEKKETKPKSKKNPTDQLAASLATLSNTQI